MGARFSCLGQSSGPHSIPKKGLDDQISEIAPSLIDFMKPGWLCTNKDQEKNMQLNKVAEERTLEDWLLASPCLNNYCSNNGAGEYHVLMKNSSRKAHTYLHGDSFEQGEVLQGQSVKVKKRVSFRLPVVADIFIFYSPAEQESTD